MLTGAMPRDEYYRLVAIDALKGTKLSQLTVMTIRKQEGETFRHFKVASSHKPLWHDWSSDYTPQFFISAQVSLKTE